MAKTTIPAGYFAAGSIATADIADDAVTADKLAANSVVSASIVNGTIATADLADDAVTQAKIADDAVGADQLAANSVVSASIVNGTIVTADLADDAITAAKIDSTATGMTFADLTVDTTTLKVDASNNRVGIGTASPSHPLHISSTGHTQYQQHRQSSGVGVGQEMKFAFNTADGTEEVYGSVYTDIKANTNGAESGNIALRVADAGSLSYVIRGSGGGDTTLYADGSAVMTLQDGGNVGIGTTSPTKALEINDTSEVDGIQLRVKGDSTRGGTMEFRRGDSFTWRIGCGGASSTNSNIPASFFGIEDGGDNLALCVAHTTYRVGIGTNSPSNKLHVKGSSGEYVYYHENGNGNFKMSHGNGSFHHFYQNGASTGFYFGSACQANGGFSTYSDERLKENITTIDSALDKVALMNGVSFTWKDTEKRGEGKQFGVTAQNMLEVDAELPKLVEDADATNEEIENDDIQTQYYSMDYARLTPYFIEAIKELKTKLEAAEARLATLEN